MEINYFEVIRKMYPEAINIGYWSKNPKTGEEWNSPIDGLIWDDKYGEKPTHEQVMNAYNSYVVPVVKERLIHEVKQIASDKILNLYPDWKQRNTLAKCCEYLFSMLQGQTPNQEDTNLINNFMSIWAVIKQIRDKSDELEGTINSKSTLEELNSLDVNSDWPG